MQPSSLPGGLIVLNAMSSRESWTGSIGMVCKSSLVAAEGPMLLEAADQPGARGATIASVQARHVNNLKRGPVLVLETPWCKSQKWGDCCARSPGARNSLNPHPKLKRSAMGGLPVYGLLDPRRDVFA